ncbi:MAG TPA: fumarylacetoacetate hydrolase family protein [Candidimonas sp.]|nr:fumarylacetoacetate hydrolase family protein [Candidimonas sp.]
MKLAIPALPVAAIPVANSDALFPVRRVYCVGRNYAAHAREMGFTGREEPFFFNKPADAVLPIADGQTGQMTYPPKTSDLQYEIELVVALGSGGRDLTPEQAAGCIWGYAIGLDMTRRDLQGQAKKQGRPWEIGKAFDQAAPVGPLHPRDQVAALDAGDITLSVNGERKQSGDLSDMIWNVPEAIAYLSSLFELKAGDIIFTGTPEGVGPVVAGDTMVGAIAGLGELRVKVA